MTHLPPSAAIFSPSVARLATSAAKDWDYVDRWLSSQFHGCLPPPFERSAETLKTLVALAAFNESANEDRDAVISAEALILRNLASTNTKVVGMTTSDTTVTDSARASPAAVVGRMLGTVLDVLSREGHVALNCLTQVSVELGNTCPELTDLERGVMTLHARLFQLQQTTSSNDALKAHVETDGSSVIRLLGNMDHDQYRPPAELARSNLELQRNVKVRFERLRDPRERTKGSAMLPGITISRLRENETAYVELLARSKDLDNEIRAFQGLAPDKDLARRQLEDLRVELHIVTQERDDVFESLVDKASPEKKRAY